MLDYFKETFLVVFILELGAAVAGTIYLKHTNTQTPYSKIFVFYLWLVVIVEIIGIYPAVNYFTNFSFIPVVEGTVFERNFWLYNSYNIVKFVVLFLFFKAQLRNKINIKIFNWIVPGFVIIAILNLIFSDVFFTRSSAFTYITGSLILMILIFVYYIELLKSDRILFFYKTLAFYISVGLLLWHVAVTPLFIYNKYFSMTSPEFVQLHSTILKFSNYFLYGIYIIAFIICLPKNKRSLLTRNPG